MDAPCITLQVEMEKASGLCASRPRRGRRRFARLQLARPFESHASVAPTAPAKDPPVVSGQSHLSNHRLPGQKLLFLDGHHDPGSKKPQLWQGASWH